MIMTSSGIAKVFQSETKKKHPYCGLMVNGSLFNRHSINSYVFTGNPGHERIVTSLEFPVSLAIELLDSELPTSNIR